MSPSVGLSFAAGKMRKNKLVTGGFRYDFTESKAAFGSILSVKIAALEPLRRVTGRIFKISKQQAKTLSLIFSLTKKPKTVKIAALAFKAGYWKNFQNFKAAS